MSEHERIDWSEARRRFEQEGATLSELAPLLDRCVQAVSQHARRYGWIKPGSLEALAREKALREFVKRDVEVVIQNLAEKHAVNREIMALVRDYVRALAAGIAPRLEHVRILRELSATLRNVESVDAAIAGLRDVDWLPEAPPVGESSTGAPTPETIRARLRAVREAQRQELAGGVQ